MGRIELELRPDTPREEVRERLARVFGIANFSYAESRPARLRRRSRRRSSPTSATSTPASFRVSATRSDKRLPFTSPQVEREVGGLIWEAKGWKVDLVAPGADHPHRDAADRGVLLLRQGAGRRRHADRHRRTRRLPAVGRHRLAGRRVPHDAPRLPGAVHPLPQLSDPVARVAGEGARDRRAADAGTSSARG